MAKNRKRVFRVDQGKAYPFETQSFKRNIAHVWGRDRQLSAYFTQRQNICLPNSAVKIHVKFTVA